MALTTAMRTPVNTVGIANGNSTIRMRYGLLMPMPRAASFTPGSTCCSPRQVLRTMGKNTTVKNCVLLNDVYIGDNVHLENCIVESRGTINPNTCYCGEDGVMIVKEKNVRYVI